MNEQGRIIFALRKKLMTEDINEKSIIRIAHEIGKRRMENNLCPELGATMVKPSLNNTCTAGEFAQRKMERLTKLALILFRKGICKTDLFPDLDWQRMQDLMFWHDENDDGKPSKIGQKGGGCDRVQDDITYNSAVFDKDGMIEGDGRLLPRQEMTQEEGFLACYGNGKGTGLNLNFPQNVPCTDNTQFGRRYMMKSNKDTIEEHEMDRTLLLYSWDKIPDELRKIYSQHNEDDSDDEEDWDTELEEEEEEDDEEEEEEEEQESEIGIDHYCKPCSNDASSEKKKSHYQSPPEEQQPLISQQPSSMNESEDFHSSIEKRVEGFKTTEDICNDDDYDDDDSGRGSDDDDDDDGGGGGDYDCLGGYQDQCNDVNNANGTVLIGGVQTHDNASKSNDLPFTAPSCHANITCLPADVWKDIVNFIETPDLSAVGSVITSSPSSFGSRRSLELASVLLSSHHRRMSSAVDAKRGAKRGASDDANDENSLVGILSSTRKRIRASYHYFISTSVRVVVVAASCVIGSATEASSTLDPKRLLLERCVAKCMSLEPADLCPNGMEEGIRDNFIAQFLNDLDDTRDNRIKRLITSCASNGIPAEGASPRIVRRVMSLAHANEQNEKKGAKRTLWTSNSEY